MPHRKKKTIHRGAVTRQTCRGTGLDEAFYITEGEEKQSGRKNQKNLHTVYEALIGAIYLDQGYEQTKGFIQKIALLEK